MRYLRWLTLAQAALLLISISPSIVDASSEKKRKTRRLKLAVGAACKNDADCEVCNCIIERFMM
jgi:hypothetical protein